MKQQCVHVFCSPFVIANRWGRQNELNAVMTRKRMPKLLAPYWHYPFIYDGKL
jgi:hypothetical protein